MVTRNETGFIFYDTETTGTETSFDQILQFGAIKTDYKFNEIDRFEIRSRLLPYVVPSPGAMCVTGVTIEQITDPTLPSHYEMVRQIRAKLLEWSPAIFIGHNSIRFDENLLRQAFYKTLHNPYLTNMNGNCRTDSIRMIQAIAKFAPDALAIPTNYQGDQVFKLDQLAPINGFEHSAAHDAIADVEATIYMCRLIADRAPSYWSGFIHFAQKAAVVDFVYEQEVFSLTDFFYSKSYSWIVTTLNTNFENKSDILVFDLSNDPDELTVMSDEELMAWLEKIPKPIRSVRANACPIVLAYNDAPEDVRNALPPIDKLRQQAARIKNDSELSRRLTKAFLQTRELKERSPHVEKQIYDNFSSYDDQVLMNRFHDIDWTQRPALIKQISDRRLRALGQRIIYVEAPDAMLESTRTEYDVAVARRLMSNDEVPWLTLPRALEQVDGLLSGIDDSKRTLLSDLHSYLTQRAEEASSLLT